MSRAASMMAAPDAAQAHASVLHWHALSYRGHLAFPGEGNFRLSMDYATGGAGVLVALASLDDPSIPAIPFLASEKAAPARSQNAGGLGS